MRTNGTWVTPNERETKNAVSKTRYTTDFGHLRGVLGLVARFCKSGVDSCASEPDTASAGCFGGSWRGISCILTPRKTGEIHRARCRKKLVLKARLKQRLACEGERWQKHEIMPHRAHFAAATDKWYLRTWQTGKSSKSDKAHAIRTAYCIFMSMLPLRAVG